MTKIDDNFFFFFLSCLVVLHFKASLLWSSFNKKDNPEYTVILGVDCIDFHDFYIRDGRYCILTLN